MSLDHTLRQRSQIESAIVQELERLGTCTFGELLTALPDYTWNQVFAAVDRLSRAGSLTLQRLGRSDYLISTDHGSADTPARTPFAW